MTYIPDGRTDENYNQKYLNELDKEFLRGFDWCLEMVVDNFFDNHFDGASDDYLEMALREQVPEGLREEYEVEYTFYSDCDGKKSEMRTVDNYADLLRMQILEWVEMSRNELITGMIDGMDDAEYQKIKEQVDGGQSEAEN